MFHSAVSYQHRKNFVNLSSFQKESDFNAIETTQRKVIA